MEKKKILVRLPNWLGDMVMSVGAVRQLYLLYPGAEVSLIAKKGLHDLLPFFPPAAHTFIFDKEAWRGLKGVWRFGKMLRQTASFDLFVSFPDSFSAAMMGYATGAKTCIGYKKEGREILLTHSYTKPKNLHRVEEYTSLLSLFNGQKDLPVQVILQHSFPREHHLVININSEATSRRLTIEKAVEIIGEARRFFTQKIILIGSAKEKAFVKAVWERLPDKRGIEPVAGNTTLPQLVQLLASAKGVLSTDSGPAHLSNALGTPTVVLFGAGNENNTAPYNKEAVKVIRLGELACEPCVKNVCLRFETPQCLERLNTNRLINALHEQLNHGT